MSREVAGVRPPRGRETVGYAGTLLLLLLSSLIVIVPLVVRGPSCGHDFDFHLLSWMETARDWSHGVPYPYWLETANYGAGEPRFLFYPPVSWLLGAAIGIVSGVFLPSPRDWVATPILFTFIAVFFAGIAVYALARHLMSRDSARVAACLFLGNPYLLFTAYERTAYAELLATGLIALLILWSLQLRPRAAPLALVIAALWLTNAPAAVMGCYALAFLLVIRMVVERDPEIAPRATAGVLTGIALAGVYLVPAIRQQRWVQIDRAIGSGMRIEDSFLFEKTGEVYHDQVLSSASWTAVWILTAGLVAAIYLLTQRRMQRSRTLAVPFCALLGVIACAQFPLSGKVWAHLPELHFLQFPWRWMSVAGIASACLVGLLMEELPLAKSGAGVKLVLAVAAVAGSVWFCSRAYYQPCDEEDRVSAQVQLLREGTGVEGTDEYTPQGADNSEIQQGLPVVRLLSSPDADEADSRAGDNPAWDRKAVPAAASERVAVTTWNAETKRVEITSSRPVYAVLRLEGYPGWKVLVNGRAAGALPHRDDGLLVIPLASGTSHVEISWHVTGDVICGRGLSLLACCLLVLLHVREKQLLPRRERMVARR